MTDQSNEAQDVEKLMTDIEKLKQVARKKLDATMKDIRKKIEEIAAEAGKAKTGG